MSWEKIATSETDRVCSDFKVMKVTKVASSRVSVSEVECMEFQKVCSIENK